MQIVRVQDQVREVRFTRQKVSGKSIVLPGKCTAYAESVKGGELLVAMLAAPTMVAKGIAAMVRGANPFTVHVEGLGVSKPCEEEYRVSVARLPGYSTAQVLIVADMPSLLIGPLEDALWRYLMSDRISTPLLREWLPQIREHLEKHAKISGTNGFGCEANVANFETEFVDKTVSSLLKKKRIFV